MQWAEGGSLDDYIDARLGKSTSLHGPTTGSPTSSSPPSFSDGPGHSRSARIRAFRAMQHAAPEDKERMRERLGMTATGKDGKGKVSWKAVHLLSAEEVLGLFRGVVEGLAFLVRSTHAIAETCFDLALSHSTIGVFCISTSSLETSFLRGTKGSSCTSLLSGIHVLAQPMA